jgi:hypothetical protein
MLKTYQVNIQANENKKSLSQFITLANKKIVCVLFNTQLLNSRGQSYYDEFELYLYNNKNELIREGLSRDILSITAPGTKIELLKEVSSVENIDIERSYIYFFNVDASRYLSLYFIVEE